MKRQKLLITAISYLVYFSTSRMHFTLLNHVVHISKLEYYGEWRTLLISSKTFWKIGPNSPQLITAQLLKPLMSNCKSGVSQAGVYTGASVIPYIYLWHVQSYRTCRDAFCLLHKLIVWIQIFFKKSNFEIKRLCITSQQIKFF